MKKLFLFFAATILSFTACTKDLKNIKVENQEMTDMAEAVNYTIPIEEAIEELYSTLDFIESERMFAAPSQSASQGKRREIDKISVIYGNVAVHPQNNSSTADKQTFATTQKDSLLYIVDFKNNAGSAVLAADSRIPDRVLAITEQGSLLDREPSTMYREGMYADSELMKGFSIYNDEFNDYYVTGNNRVLNHIENYVLQTLSMYDDKDAYTGLPYDVTTKIGDWEVLEKISPLLTTTWHQDAPFNNYTPHTRWSLFHKWQKSPAGCVPIAMAQIMAYHKFPKNYEVNGYYLDWDAIRQDKTGAGLSEYNTNAIAGFIHRLGDWSGAWYTPKFAFVLPSRAKKTMETMGYEGMYMHTSWSAWDNNHANVVMDMLRSDNPVFIASIAKVASGHAWVIDGYIDRQRKIENTYKYHADPTKVEIKITIQQQQFIHCNWGWGGKDDGYYTMGIFHAGKEHDMNKVTMGKEKDDNNFNWGFHIFSYKNPNK